MAVYSGCAGSAFSGPSGQRIVFPWLYQMWMMTALTCSPGCQHRAFLGLPTWLLISWAPWLSRLLSCVEGPVKASPAASRVDLSVQLCTWEVPGQVNRASSSRPWRDRVPPQPSRIAALGQGAPPSTCTARITPEGGAQSPESPSRSALSGQGTLQSD